MLADAGIASRRACEQLILDGEVEVDGEVVRTLPCLVDPRTSTIEVRGLRLEPATSLRTVMVFKPRGVVCTNRDPHKRRRAIDIVPHRTGERLYPVGRLDVDSSGLLLLTNDGELANRLTHPRYEVHKGYEVMVQGRIDETSVEKLRRGVFLPHRRRGGASRAAAADLKVLRRDRDRSVLFVELSEGRNRQIRRMLERLGHEVKRLRRVSMGPLTLSGLRPGQWRELSPEELAELERAAFGRGSAAKSSRAPRKASYPKPPRRTKRTAGVAARSAEKSRPVSASPVSPASRGDGGRRGGAGVVRGKAAAKNAGRGPRGPRRNGRGGGRGA